MPWPARPSLLLKAYLYGLVVLMAVLAAGVGLTQWALESGRREALVGFAAGQLVRGVEELYAQAGPKGPPPKAWRKLGLALGMHVQYQPYAWANPAWRDQAPGQPILRRGPGWWGPRSLTIALPVHRPGQAKGVVVARFRRPPLLEGAMRRVLVPLGAMLLLALVLLPPLVFWVVRPLRALVQVADRLGQGGLGEPVPRTRGDEWGRLEAALEGLRARVVAMLGRQESLLRDVAHELNSPLTRARLALSMLPEHPMKAKLHQELEGLGGLVQELLELARLRQGEAWSMEALDLAELAQAAVAQRGLQAQSQGLAWGLALDPAPLVGDRRALGRALGNLLDNALRHSPSGGRLRVRTAVGGPEAPQGHGGPWFAVEDEGPGPPAGWGEALFEAFARPDPARSAHSGGAGVGLAIVKAAAEGHGGRVGLEPGPRGQGARAWLALPGKGQPFLGVHQG